MDPLGNAILGVFFLIVGAGGTFLMYHLWGYPFDHETLTSQAPPRLMRLHRILGWIYFGIYVFLMSQMLPRLWTYQIEFPARTVAHFTLGMAIGVILVVKISIVRFFKHLESALVPVLGTGLLLCTVLLIGLSAPFAFRETYLRATAVEGDLFGTENLERVERHLRLSGLEDEQRLKQLASRDGLRAGQNVLTTDCIQCHDLRTVLAQPRTPEGWRTIVQRMAERSSVLSPISQDEQWQVTSYLIAISPELQRSMKVRRAQRQAEQASEQVVSRLAEKAEEGEPIAMDYDPDRARQLYETLCSQCHGLENVENAALTSEQQVRETVGRMVGYGLSGTEEELGMVIRYVTEAYVN